MQRILKITYHNLYFTDKIQVKKSIVIMKESRP